ncbi:MAG: NAD-dependent epimerase/dehydratase family protein [Candidatus Omnitrophica bacterium]|nr:NAD-dependent epimerase/dehydratase family protein [Candidatus Omnitrophota bacterium]
MRRRMQDGFFRGKNVLITGGMGFVGSNLAISLESRGAKVTLVDSMVRDTGGNLFNIKDISEKVLVNFSDVRDEHSMNFLVRGKDIMFNLAGQVSHIDSMVDPYTDLDINARSQLSILEACRKYNPGIKIVYASTRQVYGRPEYLPVDERHPLNPVDINGVNKLSGEWYHVLYNSVYGIKTVSLRMTNTFGPRLLMKHSRQGFIGWFVRQVIEGREIRIFGDGRQLRDLNYIDDVVDALLICAENDNLNGKIFNLGNHPPITLEEIAKLLIKINRGGKYRLIPFPKESRKIDIGHYYASFDKFRDATGWEPKVGYEEGLRRMMAYYKKNIKHYLE